MHSFALYETDSSKGYKSQSYRFYEYLAVRLAIDLKLMSVSIIIIIVNSSSPSPSLPSSSSPIKLLRWKNQLKMWQALKAKGSLTKEYIDNFSFEYSFDCARRREIVHKQKKKIVLKQTIIDIQTALPPPNLLSPRWFPQNWPLTVFTWMPRSQDVIVARFHENDNEGVYFLWWLPRSPVAQCFKFWSEPFTPCSDSKDCTVARCVLCCYKCT